MACPDHQNQVIKSIKTLKAFFPLYYYESCHLNLSNYIYLVDFALKTVNFFFFEFPKVL